MTRASLLLLGALATVGFAAIVLVALPRVILMRVPVPPELLYTLSQDEQEVVARGRADPGVREEATRDPGGRPRNGEARSLAPRDVTEQRRHRAAREGASMGCGGCDRDPSPARCDVAAPSCRAAR